MRGQEIDIQIKAIIDECKVHGQPRPKMVEMAEQIGVSIKTIGLHMQKLGYDTKRVNKFNREMSRAEYKREYQKEYYERNKEKVLKHQKEYDDRNKERQAKYNREYYERNRVKLLEYNREYYKRNKAEQESKEDT